MGGLIRQCCPHLSGRGGPACLPVWVSVLPNSLSLMLSTLGQASSAAMGHCHMKSPKRIAGRLAVVLCGPDVDDVSAAHWSLRSWTPEVQGVGPVSFLICKVGLCLRSHGHVTCDGRVSLWPCVGPARAAAWTVVSGTPAELRAHSPSPPSVALAEE